MLSEKNIEQKHRLLRKLKNNHPDVVNTNFTNYTNTICLVTTSV